MWSLGVIVFTCLTGHFPFDNEDVNKIFEAILKQNYKFNFFEKKNISDEARTFVKKLMRKDYKKRISSKMAMK